MIHLSIFPKCKALPVGKEEKNAQARFTSKPYYPTIVSINTEEELIEIITNNAWSPSLFHGHRNQANFYQTDLMVLDIDDGMTIEESEKLVDELDVACLCMPSTSHTDEHHRFRLIFPLARTIRNKEEFVATMMKLAEVFPADPACIGDTGRFFFGCKMVDGYWMEGQLLSPEKAPERPKNSPRRRLDGSDKIVVGEDIESVVEALYGEKRTKIPEAVDFFIREAHTGISGGWHNAANAFLFVTALQGVEYDVISQVFEELCPEPLDSHDEFLLDRSTKDGYDARKDDEL